MTALKNVRILDDKELEFLVGKYIFEFQEGLSKNYIVVTTSNYARKVLHEADKSFTINTQIKRITINPQAIEFWKELDFKYNLIEVQNALNILSISYQEITRYSILEAIRKNYKICEK